MTEIMNVAAPKFASPATAREDWHRIADDTVVTRDHASLPRSLFIDDSWNVEAYGTNLPIRNIHFRGHTSAKSDPDVATASKRQWKQTMYFLMHEAVDDIPAPQTMKRQMGILRGFAAFADERRITLYQAMSSVTTVLEYAGNDGTQTKSVRLHAILAHIHRLGVEATGVQIPLAKLHRPMLDIFNDRPESSQHPVIPTRIYQHFLASCERDLGAIESVAPHLENQIARACAGEPLNPPDELVDAAAKFGYRVDVPELSAFVTETYALCQLVIAAFTGMRASEAANLPYQCLKVVRHDGVEHYSIEGVTTKLSGGRAKRACWVTSQLAVRAVRLAQRLSGVIHQCSGDENHLRSTDGSHLLFCRLGLYSGEYEASRGPTNIDTYIDVIRERAFPLIEPGDVAELKLIDPHRAWEDEGQFGINQRWPFTRHQLRRTLALYAHRSGLVTLPSLKRQLQHITMEMSMYYARGSAFAKGFIEADKDHFARDWADAQGLSEYLAYAAQVLFSDERLFGGHAAWVQSKAVQESPVSVFSREQTLAMFNKGEIAYRETVLGGCTNVGPCKSSPLDWLPLKCLGSNCKSLIVVPSKLQRVINSQQRQVEKLSAFGEDSVEYRMESQTLANLLAAQENLIGKGPQ